MTKRIKGRNVLNSALNGALTSGLRSSLARSGSFILPVSDGLVLWLETTSKDSFDVDERVGGASVSTWYDIKTGSSSKFNATQSISSRQPTYTKNVINGIPALFFDDVEGGQDGLAIDTNLSLNDEYTIFLVFNTIGAAGPKRTMQSPSVNWVIGPYGGYISYYSVGWVTQNAYSLTPGQFYITTAQRTSSASAFYINGTDQTTNSSPFTPPGNIGLGASGQFAGEGIDGYIAEVIVYDRALITTEREQMEEYLSAKLGIALG